MENNVLLEVKNLVTEFTSEGVITKAVDDVSFTINKGETIGIVGESGSGKSVSSLSIMGLIPNPPGKITNGEINYYGLGGKVNLLKLREKEMRKYRGNEMAMIFQEPMTSLNPVFTCGNQVMETILQHTKYPEIPKSKNLTENIIKWAFRLVPYILLIACFFLPLGGAIKWISVLGVIIFCLADISNSFWSSLYKTTKEKKAKARTIELFEQTQLPNPERIFKSYPHELSGGQKQRVMIAMAMSCNPQLLIADEPTTALDVTVQKTILELMNDLQKKHNMSIVFITHDLGVIAEVADKVLVMYKGKIVEQGSVYEIFSNPRHPYTKGLLACRPPLNKPLKKLATISDFMQVDENDQITAKAASVSEVLKRYEQLPHEKEEQYQKLFRQEPILQVKNLKTWFPVEKTMMGSTRRWLKAVDDVTFDVYPGETLGLVGESGCGKTTLGRTIIRLLDPVDGQIIFNGKNITKISQNEMRPIRKDMQIIFQDPYSSLNPRMTVGEAIMEPMRVHDIGGSESSRKNKVVELLEKVNMKAAHFSRYPHEFSGGQRQRICIARSLSVHPKFIICDESVSALDVSVQAQVLNLLNELKREFNFTYIFISHDLSVVKFMSDRMIVMNKGVIEEMGKAEDIYANPQKEYTKALIKAIPKGELSDIQRSMDKKRVNF